MDRNIRILKLDKYCPYDNVELYFALEYNKTLCRISNNETSYHILQIWVTTDDKYILWNRCINYKNNDIRDHRTQIYQKFFDRPENATLEFEKIIKTKTARRYKVLKN